MAHIAGNGNQNTIDGTEFDDLIVGHRQNETINGFGGNDVIYGGYGDDTIFGGDGNDLIQGDQGADTLTGGAGADTFKFANWMDSQDQNNGRDHITDFQSGVDKIDLSQVAANNGITINWSQIEIETLNNGDARVHVHTIVGNTTWDLGFDVSGDAPVQSDFILA